MVARLTGGLLRAVLMMLLIATPSMLLQTGGSGTPEIVALVALAAGLFTAVEYTSLSPSLVEFRDAPPFNRIRFATAALSVFLLSLLAGHADDASTFTALIAALTTPLGHALDMPYSPVRLVMLTLPEGTSGALADQVRVGAALSYLLSLASLLIFVALLRFRGWPMRSGNFNVWINLPTFDPTSGPDVIWRLRRDGQVNLVLGFLLPFIVPALFNIGAPIFGPIDLSNPHTLIWTMTGWAFLPASLLMRGVALQRVADMIGAQRERASAREAGLMPA
ncbi:hypothetical protein CLV79_101302 [Limimaricola soesokkakensis]|uniref:Uncharacterized protein n=2 Tax=Limimaricola soesokkakensis TaxID=1343159 RepID=A0A1X6YLI0_9RHOB|nr:hypothetical protein CLV79_101302 [Limimaricola soesokkakensis]SLN24649.1 hypothetical protein LOS8367_00784 [Limimaricola soesokkakensis]